MHHIDRELHKLYFEDASEKLDVENSEVTLKLVLAEEIREWGRESLKKFKDENCFIGITAIIEYIEADIRVVKEALHSVNSQNQNSFL